MTRGTHRDDAMNRRCNDCEHLVRQCICNWQYCLNDQDITGFDPATFDQGGWLRQGLTLAEHRPSQPDAVLTNKQWAAVTSIATEGAREVNIDAHVYVGDREITDIVRVEAKEVVKGNNQELTRNLTAKRRKR